MFLIGNKADLEDSRLITTENALQLKKDFDFDFFMEASAKSGYNVEQLFAEAAQLLYKEFSHYKKKAKKPNEKLKLNEKEKPKKTEKKCC